MSETKAMPVALLEWKEMKRNSLRGFAKVRVGKTLVLSDVTVHASGGRRWAQPASKPQVGKDGVALKDSNGKIKYTSVCEFIDEGRDQFSLGVIEAVEREYPGATAVD